jgi:hypothetical protein
MNAAGWCRFRWGLAEIRRLLQLVNARLSQKGLGTNRAQRLLQCSGGRSGIRISPSIAYPVVQAVFPQPARDNECKRSINSGHFVEGRRVMRPITAEGFEKPKSVSAGAAVKFTDLAPKSVTACRWNGVG